MAYKGTTKTPYRKMYIKGKYEDFTDFYTNLNLKSYKGPRLGTPSREVLLRNGAILRSLCSGEDVLAGMGGLGRVRTTYIRTYILSSHHLPQSHVV
jgi:hypothetical protein